jgi:hypothetical protein
MIISLMAGNLEGLHLQGREYQLHIRDETPLCLDLIVLLWPVLTKDPDTKLYVSITLVIYFTNKNML